MLKSQAEFQSTTDATDLTVTLVDNVFWLWKWQVKRQDNSTLILTDGGGMSHCNDAIAA